MCKKGAKKEVIVKIKIKKKSGGGGGQERCVQRMGKKSWGRGGLKEDANEDVKLL